MSSTTSSNPSIMLTPASSNSSSPSREKGRYIPPQKREGYTPKWDATDTKPTAPNTPNIPYGAQWHGKPPVVHTRPICPKIYSEYDIKKGVERRMTMTIREVEKPFYTPAESPPKEFGDKNGGGREILYTFTPLAPVTNGYPFPRINQESENESNNALKSDFRGDSMSGQENARLVRLGDIEKFAPGHGIGKGNGKRSGDFGFVGKEIKEGAVGSGDFEFVRKEIIEGRAPSYRYFTR